MVVGGGGGGANPDRVVIRRAVGVVEVVIPVPELPVLRHAGLIPAFPIRPAGLPASSICACACACARDYARERASEPRSRRGSMEEFRTLAAFGESERERERESECS